MRPSSSTVHEGALPPRVVRIARQAPEEKILRRPRPPGPGRPLGGHTLRPELATFEEARAEVMALIAEASRFESTRAGDTLYLSQVPG